MRGQFRHWVQKLPEGESDDFKRFVAQWRLGDEAQRVLHGLQPATKLKVIREFAPGDVVCDLNAIFLRFAEKLDKCKVGDATKVFPQFAEGESDDFERFVNQWSLGYEAQRVLHGLQPATKLTVIREFALRESHTRHVGRDVNGLFLRFVESVNKRKGHHIGKGKGFTKGMPLPAAVPVAVPFAAPPGLTAELAISQEMLLSFRGRCDLQASAQVPPAPYRMVPSSSLELQVTAGEQQNLTPEQRSSALHLTSSQMSTTWTLGFSAA